MLRSCLTIFTVVAVLAATPLPAVSDPLPEAFSTARAAYQQAVTERGRAVDHALSAVDAYLAAHPEDALALVYRGSLLTLNAAEAFFPWTKLSYLNEGLDLMDTALPRTPAVEALVVRGLTNARIPDRFNRAALARQDLAQALAHPDFTTLPEATQAEVTATHAALGGTP